MNRNVSARAIIVKGNLLFCVRLKPYLGATTLQDEFWCVPGGGVDLGEDITSALKREIMEELGIQAVVGDLLFIQQFLPKDGGAEQLEFFFHVTNTNDFDNIDLSQTTHGSDEITEYGFIDPSSQNVLPKFLQNIDLSQVKQTGNVPQLFSYLNSDNA